MKTLLLLILFVSSSIPLFAQKLDAKMVYWNADKKACPICDAIKVDGNTFYIFDTPEIELVFTGETHESKLIYTQIQLRNKSTQRFDFEPSQSVLFLFKTRTEKVPQQVFPIEPDDAAKKVKGNQGLKNYFISLAAHMQRRSVWVNSNTNGSATVSDRFGNSAAVDYTAQTTSTISVPNEEAIANAEDRIAERNRQAKSRYDYVLSSALRANTVFPEKKIAGNVYFPYVKGTFMYLGVRVGDSLYLVGFNIEP